MIGFIGRSSELTFRLDGAHWLDLSVAKSFQIFQGESKTLQHDQHDQTGCKCSSWPTSQYQDRLSVRQTLRQRRPNIRWISYSSDLTMVFSSPSTLTELTAQPPMQSFAHWVRPFARPKVRQFACPCVRPSASSAPTTFRSSA